VDYGLCVHINKLIVKIKLLIIVVEEILIDNLIVFFFFVIDKEGYVSVSDAVKIVKSKVIIFKGFVFHGFSEGRWFKLEEEDEIDDKNEEKDVYKINAFHVVLHTFE
jgi:hypothetical protein